MRRHASGERLYLPVYGLAFSWFRVVPGVLVSVFRKSSTAFPAQPAWREVARRHQSSTFAELRETGRTPLRQVSQKSEDASGITV